LYSFSLQGEAFLIPNPLSLRDIPLDRGTTQIPLPFKKNYFQDVSKISCIIVAIFGWDIFIASISGLSSKR